MPKTIVEIIKGDLFVVLLCVLTILICIATLNSINNYQNTINRAWEKQWDAYCNPFFKPNFPDIDFNILGGYNGTDNIINNT